MNERVKELYAEAMAYADSVVPPERRYNDIYYAIISGKHAELIVRECAGVCEEYHGTAGDQAARYIGQGIKEHFGVEE